MESKRIFNQAKMNRDIDDRLLPEGSYRYALNVNIGESEGGDIGAVENLKGNELIEGNFEDTNVTTIGSVRDPNNDKIYWFVKGDTFDAIYESDGEAITPILKDSVDRDLVKPTCVPTFTTFVNDPVGDDNNRPTPSFSYKTPVGGCTDSSANNYDSTATFDDGSCTFDPPPPSTSLSVLISGDGTFANSESPVTLTATASEVLGTVSYLWDTGETTQTISVSGADATITGSVTVTDSGRTTDNTATDNYSVTFQSVAPDDFTWGVRNIGTVPAGTTLGAGVSGIETQDGVPFTIPTYQAMVSIDSPTTMRWATLPSAVPTGVPAGLTVSARNGTIESTTAVNYTLSGTYTPTGDEEATFTWSGGSIEAIPAMFDASVAISTWPDYIIFSSGGQTLGTSAGSDQATYTFSNLPAGVFSFNAAIAWSSPSLGVEFFLEDRAISTVLGNPTTAGFNITFPPGTPTTFSETLTADIVITVSGGIFDGEEVTITSGATQTSQFA